MFVELFSQTALFCKWKYLCSLSNTAMLLPWKHFCSQVRVLSFSAFVFLSEMRAFASTSFFFPTTVLVFDKESQSSFVMSAHFRFESRFMLQNLKFLFIVDGFRFLPVMVPSDTKCQACQSTENVQDQCIWCRQGTRVEWQSSARLVTCWTGGGQLLSQLLPYLEDMAKKFHGSVSYGRTMHYFR